MTMRNLSSILLLAAAAAGCAAGSSGGSTGNYSKDASGSGSGGMAGAGGGGGMIISTDAAVSQGDAAQAPVLSTDALTFNWDVRNNAGVDSGPAVGSGGAAGGTGGKGGGGSSGTSSGGSIGSGGVSGKGGSTGLGGSVSDASGTGPDVRSDAGVNDLPPIGPDGAVSPSDASIDAVKSDTSSRCVANIQSLVPSTDSLDKFQLVAGASTQVVLRAQVVSNGPVSPIWTWQAYSNNTPISGTYPPSPSDNAAVMFAIANSGPYTFTATDRTGACTASIQAYAWDANPCKDCDKQVILRAAPPPASDIPVQEGSMYLNGSPPFSASNFALVKGVEVVVSPSVGGNLVSSYVRISTTVPYGSSIPGDLVADGLADPKAGFAARLLSMDSKSALLNYDVLVVPIDGPNGDTVAATAPQLFQSHTAPEINTFNFSLSGGKNVTGTLTSSDGKAVTGARVILTNRDPQIPAQPRDLIFSSVGNSDVQGNYLLHAQPNTPYWVSVSPAAGLGLAEGLAPNPVTLTGDTVLSFQWNAINTTSLTLRVTNSDSLSVEDGTVVRLTSAQAATVGTLIVGGSPQQAQGNVRVQGTTNSGSVRFDNLPSGVAYDVLLVPATLKPNAATTLRTVIVPAGGGELPVQLQAQGKISGKLLWGAASSATDWSQVNVYAYDRSADTPESPRAVSVNPDGSFSIGASPGRPYVLMATPNTGSALARTFVGPGPLEANDFTITQRVQAKMDWIATVVEQGGGGLPGTALRVFCDPSWPYCVDSTLPLAETTSGSGGVFQFALPDPATR